MLHRWNTESIVLPLTLENAIMFPHWNSDIEVVAKLGKQLSASYERELKLAETLMWMKASSLSIRQA